MNCQEKEDIIFRRTCPDVILAARIARYCSLYHIEGAGPKARARSPKVSVPGPVRVYESPKGAHRVGFYIYCREFTVIMDSTI